VLIILVNDKLQWIEKELGF